MTIEMESILCQWEDNTSELFAYTCNLIIGCADRQELAVAVKSAPLRQELEKNFIWGFGSHHFWLKQRNPSNGEIMKDRLIFVALNNRKQ